jgi:hypothetical protein
LAKIASGSPPPLVSNRIGQRNKREKSGVRVVRLGLDSLVSFVKRERRKEKRRRKIDEFGRNSLEF